MSKPPALAPTIALAEHRIKHFVEHIAKYMDMTVHQFYACEPCEHLIESGYGANKETWIEGHWVLELLGNDFSPHDLPTRNSIRVDLQSVQLRPHPEGSRLGVSFLLTARVLR